MKPLFKVGQKVTIKDIGDDREEDYPYGFVFGMQKLKNQVCIIRRVGPSCNNYLSSPYYKEYDGYVYEIQKSNYLWSSPMFQETYEL